MLRRLVSGFGVLWGGEVVGGGWCWVCGSGRRAGGGLRGCGVAGRAEGEGGLQSLNLLSGQVRFDLWACDSKTFHTPKGSQSKSRPIHTQPFSQMHKLMGEAAHNCPWTRFCGLLSVSDRLKQKHPFGCGRPVPLFNCSLGICLVLGVGPSLQGVFYCNFLSWGGTTGSAFEEVLIPDSQNLPIHRMLLLQKWADSPQKGDTPQSTKSST